MTDDWGWVPFPKGPSAKDWSCYGKENGARFILRGVKDPDQVVKGTVKELADKYGVDIMTMTGSVRYFGIGKYEGKLSVHTGRERDCLESRLRRWQFYGDIAED